MMTWQEWQEYRRGRRDAMRLFGTDAPSRRSTSFNAAERHMRRAFGGARIPAFAQRSAEGVNEAGEK